MRDALSEDPTKNVADAVKAGVATASEAIKSGLTDARGVGLTLEEVTL